MLFLMFTEYGQAYLRVDWNEGKEGNIQKSVRCSHMCRLPLGILICDYFVYYMYVGVYSQNGLSAWILFFLGKCTRHQSCSKYDAGCCGWICKMCF